MDIEIIAHVNSKKPRTEKDLFGTLHVYVKEPAMEGRANLAITQSLAKHFNTNPSSVALLRGHKSKKKFFRIDIKTA